MSLPLLHNSVLLKGRIITTTLILLVHLDLNQVWPLPSLKVSRQLLTNDFYQVSSISLLMAASTALANKGLFQLTRRPSLTWAIWLSFAETIEGPGCSQVKLNSDPTCSFSASATTVPRPTPTSTWARAVRHVSSSRILNLAGNFRTKMIVLFVSLESILK